ncbi:MAG: hypothetical protein ACTSQX_11705 [Candidatus Heimdallarchaeota archaeon]
MAETQGKLKAELIGRLESPMIVAKPFIKKNGCWIRVVGDPFTEKYSLLTPIGKLVKGEQKTPTVLRGYRGYVKVSCVGNSKEKLLTKLDAFLIKRFLGGHTSEGYGRVNWLECEIEEYTPNNNSFKRKLKIRKGLGTNYPKELQRLLIALMLHDFVDNKLHPSKIYHSITIEDEEMRDACVDHHNGEESTNKLLPLVKHYDKLASRLFRKKKVNVHQRYNKGNQKIDLQKLVQELEEKQYSAYKLYNYIYNSNDLNRIVESLRFGENNLRNHLLVMVNLAINDYYWKKLIITKGIISLSTSKRGDLATVMDAEMHSFPDHE